MLSRDSETPGSSEDDEASSSTVRAPSPFAPVPHSTNGKEGRLDDRETTGKKTLNMFLGPRSHEALLGSIHIHVLAEQAVRK